MSYKFFFFYLLTKISILKVFAVISVADKGILPLEKNSIGIRFFIDIENESRVGTCKVYSRVKKCCLTDLDEEDCGIMYAIGITFEVTKPKDRKTLLYIFPTLCPYDLVGYCDVLLDYRCSKNRDRLHVNIPFDTTISKSKRSNPLVKALLGNVKSFACESLDQNSLYNCFPIDCDVKYSGQRSFYDKDINRCIKTPVCVGEADKELSSTVYVPTVNVCKDLECPLSTQDIYAISTGLGTVIQTSILKEDDVRFEFESNCSTISQNLYLLKDLMYGKLCPCNVNSEDLCKSAVLGIVFCVLSICATLLSFLFCANMFVWIYRQWSKGNIDAFFARVKKKFKRTENKRHLRRSRINSEIRNTLLREVIIKDIPLELRESVEGICDRMEKEVRKKKRYRKKDIGSQISLQKEILRDVLSSSTSTETLCSEKDALIK
ncbi:jg4485 [Pararge aegeria aegeria]|uniref:Jg4485 protein n=1 Tax=Pararge aegeria aegeria TaxID=348720 RepID=A0A8S4SA65_9NEOP|nr:jg4485 [Pararge aegeria aegeria]